MQKMTIYLLTKQPNERHNEDSHPYNYVKYENSHIQLLRHENILEHSTMDINRL